MSFGIPVRNGVGVGLLASTSLSTRNRTGFNPAAVLFGAGEPGGWYDPSDLSTMFQDTAGTTPVTATGQTVGLLLDKSQGLVLGPELVTNGDFSGGSTGWTLAASATVTGGALSVNSVTTENFCVSTGTISATSRTYLVAFDVTRTSGAFSVFVGQVAAANQLFGAQINTSGSRRGYVLYGLPGGSSNTIIFRAEGGFVGTIDNISVKELAGNHLTQATAADRPAYGIEPFGGRRNLLTYTEQFDNAAWTKSALTVTANNTTAPDGATTADLAVPTAANAEHYVDVAQTAFVSGTAYSLSVYAKASGYKWVRLAFSSSVMPASERAAWFDVDAGTLGTVQANVTASIVSVGNGWYRCSISRVATSSATPGQSGFIQITNADNATSFTGNGTSGMHWWGAQLETGSTATAYQRVTDEFNVTEAGVPSVSYLTFITNKWFISPTITPGIDKAQVFAGVRKLSDAAAGEVAGTSTGPAGFNGTFFLRAPVGAGSSNYQYRSRGTTANGASYTNGAVAAPITNVITGLSDISGPSEALRVNGVPVASNTLTQGTGNYAAYPLYVGRTGGASNPFNGRMYQLLVRFGANLDAATITTTETYVNSKTGAYV